MPLKIPICNFDAKTGILCAKCEQRLNSGQITEADVIVSKVLVQLAEKNQDVNKLNLVRARKVDGNFVIELDTQSISLLRSNTELKNAIQEKLDARIWVVTASSSEKKFIEDMFYPTRVLTVNTVWLPDGAKLTKVIIPYKALKYFNSIEEIKKVVKEVKGIELIVDTERGIKIRR